MDRVGQPRLRLGSNLGQKALLEHVEDELARVGDIAHVFAEVRKLDPVLATAIGEFVRAGHAAATRLTELEVIEIEVKDNGRLH